MPQRRRRAFRASRRTARGPRSATRSRRGGAERAERGIARRFRRYQVGAASRALASGPLLCASLKSNLGHLEAAAAAAGLASLVAGPLLAGAVAVNAQLRRSTRACLKGEARETRCIARRLNAHLASIASSGSFRMPGEVLPRCGDATAAARLSSFGFSGTIAHALFASATGARSSTASGVSLYRF